MVHTFVMMGQSNMAGRGYIGEVEAIANDRLFMLRNGRWRPLKEPVSTDRDFAGVSPAVSFADAYAKHFACDVGLVPCADGGTSLADWSVGGQLYQNAVYQTKLAQNVGEIKGILWHQGEGDSERIEDAGRYATHFLAILRAYIKDCDLPDDTKIVVGELGEFLKNGIHTRIKYSDIVNEQMGKVAADHPNIALARSAGLTSNPDELHFNAKSAREFGKRYFQAYLML